MVITRFLSNELLGKNTSLSLLKKRGRINPQILQVRSLVA
jgi:hypothetical protein